MELVSLKTRLLELSKFTDFIQFGLVPKKRRWLYYWILRAQSECIKCKCFIFPKGPYARISAYPEMHAFFGYLKASTLKEGSPNG